MARRPAMLLLLLSALASYTAPVLAQTKADLESQIKALAEEISKDFPRTEGNHPEGNHRREDNYPRGGRVHHDPIVTDFSGRTFGFGEGQDGAFFNLISEENHQITMKLTGGTHGRGTYINGIGVRYLDHQVIAERGEDDKLHVSLDGERLHLRRGETEQEHTLAGAHGLSEARVLWHSAHPTLGQVVQIHDDLFSVSVNVVPKSDSEPAHLNFDVLLLREPEHQLKGVVGGAYDRLAAGNVTSAEPDDNYFHGDEEEYLMDSYFATGHRHDAFGTAAAAGSSARRRQLIQHSEYMVFPMTAHVGGLVEYKPVAVARGGASRKFGP